MANIKSNNHRKIDCRILDDLYMDFMLSKNEAINTDIDTSKLLAAFLDFSQVKDKNVVSSIAWYNAQESNNLLENIGYTGVDNGFIRFEKDRISNDEFLDLFTKSTFDLSKHGNKFFVTEVSGNTKTTKYPIDYHEDYVALKGGFYQGFRRGHYDRGQSYVKRACGVPHTSRCYRGGERAPRSCKKCYRYRKPFGGRNW